MAEPAGALPAVFGALAGEVAASGTGVTVVDGTGGGKRAGGADAARVAGGRRQPWAQVIDRAAAAADHLTRVEGIGPGWVMRVPSAVSVDLVTGIVATWLAGAAVQVERPGGHAGDDAPPGTRPVAVVPPGGPEATGGLVGAAWRAPWAVGAVPSAGDVAIVQYTSGTTGEPGRLLVPAGALVDHVRAAARHLGIDGPDEVAVSWLPLFHDMGLVGMLCLALFLGHELVLASPASFMRRPLSWLSLCAEGSGTFTAAPDFAYRVVARHLAGRAAPDLTRMRAFVDGGEPISPHTVRDMAGLATAGSLRPGALVPAYGLAEAPLAVTLCRPGEDAAVVDGRGLARDGLVAVGTPLAGIDVTLEPPPDLPGAPAFGGVGVGEVVVSGTAVCGPPASPGGAPVPLGPVRTGDLAFWDDGRLVVCGRSKELIIVGGRNLVPAEVERIAQGVAGARPGRVVAFGRRSGLGTEEVVVVAEPASSPPGATGPPDAARPADVARAVQRRVHAELNVRPRVAVVAPGSVPKTSSGKLQRRLCGELLAGGGLDVLATA